MHIRGANQSECDLQLTIAVSHGAWHRTIPSSCRLEWRNSTLRHTAPATELSRPGWRLEPEVRADTDTDIAGQITGCQLGIEFKTNDSRRTEIIHILLTWIPTSNLTFITLRKEWAHRKETKDQVFLTTQGSK